MSDDEEIWTLSTERIAQVLADVRKTPCPRSACCVDEVDRVRFALHIIAEKALAELLVHRAANSSHVNAELATIGPLMTQAEAEQLRGERAAERDDDELTDDDLKCWLREDLAPPLHQALVELRCHRAECAAARANLAAVGVTDDGPIDQLVCTLAGLYLELQQRAEAARTATAERRYIDDGDGGCSACGKPYTYHSAVAFTDPQEFRCPAGAQSAAPERVRDIVASVASADVEIGYRASELRPARTAAPAKPCRTCGKLGHLPQDHAGWDQSKDLP